MTAIMPVTKRTRYEVLKRDNHTCRYCHATDSPLTVDHVTPVALGGSDGPENLVAACRDCNSGKASTSPTDALVADVAQDAIRWTAAQGEAARIRLLDRKKRNAYVKRFDKAWQAENFGAGGEHTHPRAVAWQASIWDFYSLGLPIEEVEDAVVIACGKMTVSLDQVWRYFCGICWRKLDQINDAAKAILEVDAANGS